MQAKMPEWACWVLVVVIALLLYLVGWRYMLPLSLVPLFGRRGVFK